MFDGHNQIETSRTTRVGSMGARAIARRRASATGSVDFVARRWRTVWSNSRQAGLRHQLHCSVEGPIYYRALGLSVLAPWRQSGPSGQRTTRGAHSSMDNTEKTSGWLHALEQSQTVVGAGRCLAYEGCTSMGQTRPPTSSPGTLHGQPRCEF